MACHSDPNLANVVFRDGVAVALIDFDLAGPGVPLWDVAAAARLWTPLRADEYIHDPRHVHLERLTIFLDAYGGDLDPEDFVDAVVANHDWLYRVVEDGSQAGISGFVDYWIKVEERAARTRDWYAAQRAALLGAARPGAPTTAGGRTGAGSVVDLDQGLPDLFDGGRPLELGNLRLVEEDLRCCR